MKAVVFSCSTGGGHNSCARYIEDEFRRNNIEADYVNYLSLVGEKQAKRAENLYLKSVSGNGKIFKNVYKLGELYNKTILKSPVYFFNCLNKKRVLNFIKENGYDLVICTHLFPALAMTKIKKKYYIPLINVATDYECIPFWNETRPDDFIIPSELLIDSFVKKKVNKDVLVPLGIPVSTTFKTKSNELDLPADKPKVLITSGSMGFGKMKDIINLILKEVPDIYLIVVCGNNKELYNSLKNIKNKNLILVGFTDNMKEYMQKSDIIITKPGGLTTSEVATMHKPLIHMMPIPGVENYNAKFYSDNKMSLCANNENEIVEDIKLLLTDKELAKELAANQKKIINENSAADLVKYITKKYK
ncbi:MAG: glycosyltransferase [Bacilli bacterium]|nr:glycosyltransferase [Bacilli bacterium]